jgi:hypothetical protein
LKVKLYYKLSFKFDYRVLSRILRIKMIVEMITHQSRMTPYRRDADLRNGSHWEGERERTHLQNNTKTMPEQLKLSKTDPSIWP